jgi:Xaa-Pro dipeptidase
VEEKLKAIPIPVQEYGMRQQAVQQEMARRDLDFLLITLPDNIHYLTGYQTEGLVAELFLGMRTSEKPFLVTRNVDMGNLLAEVDRSLISDMAFYTDDADSPDAITLLLDLTHKHQIGPARIGVEFGSLYLTVLQFRRLANALAPADLVDIGDMLDSMRWIKSARELDLHRTAGSCAVESMKAALAATRPGATDGDVAAAAIDGMIGAGGEWIANWPHIRTGNQSGLAHRTWQNMKIEHRQPTIIELCGVARRYHSPIYRTVIFDSTPEQRKVSAAVREANLAGKVCLKPSVTTGSVFAEVERVVRDYGCEELIACRNGYMVGIGFQPNWVQRGGLSFVRGGEAVLRPGMVFHFLTLLLKPNEFGIGESSTMAITETGAEDMTPGLEPGPFLYD